MGMLGTNKNGNLAVKLVFLTRLFHFFWTDYINLQDKKKLHTP